MTKNEDTSALREICKYIAEYNEFDAAKDVDSILTVIHDRYENRKDWLGLNYRYKCYNHEAKLSLNGIRKRYHYLNESDFSEIRNHTNMKSSSSIIRESLS